MEKLRKVKKLPRAVHVEKKAIRVLGIAESFKETQRFSALAGVVMRADLVIDGFGVERLTIAGSDGSNAVAKLFKGFRRNDISSMVISGSVLSLYNILDLDFIRKETETPVLAVSFKAPSSDLHANIRRRFPSSEAEKKIKLLDKLPESSKVKVKTGYSVYVRSDGIGKDACERLLNRFTLQGAIPEPIRVARLLAKSISQALPS